MIIYVWKYVYGIGGFGKSLCNDKVNLRSPCQDQRQRFGQFLNGFQVGIFKTAMKIAHGQTPF